MIQNRAQPSVSIDKASSDTEVAIVPFLVTGGIPLLPSPAKRIKLTLTGHKTHSPAFIKESGKRWHHFQLFLTIVRT